MLKTEIWLVIRDLYSQGLSISKISEIAGHDRKTVRKDLRLKAVPEPQKRKTRPSKLDPTFRRSLLKSSIFHNFFPSTLLSCP